MLYLDGDLVVLHGDGDDSADGNPSYYLHHVRFMSRLRIVWAERG